MKKERLEPMRIRIMSEAYDLADRGDSEGFNSVKVMCSDVLALIETEIATEREKVAQWMIERGFATGHGDSIEDLLKELEWQVAERERNACAKVCDDWPNGRDDVYLIGQAIRARGNDLQTAIEKGTKAWADVPDATEWVEELRGNTPDCKTHPDAPHGFDRNASHSADRYVCECEGWEPKEKNT